MEGSIYKLKHPALSSHLLDSLGTLRTTTEQEKKQRKKKKKEDN